MSAPVMLERRWTPGFALDVHAVLGPLRRGHADPAWQRDQRGAVWLARNTPTGTAVQMIASAGADVLVRAAGDGAGWCLETAPALLGADDDDSAFVAHHPLVAETRRRCPGLRLGATGTVWDVLLAAILEQKVTGFEARRSWRDLCRRFGTPVGALADAALSTALFAPPGPAAIRAVTDWQWHKAGVDGARRRTILHAAAVAHRLETAPSLGSVEGRTLLRKVPGIGVWTAAEVAQRSWGDADAVSFGDFHIPNTVGHALLGHDLDDVGLAELLAPYAPQRHRAVRYVELSGHRRPRMGPRFSPRDYRAL